MAEKKKGIFSLPVCRKESPELFPAEVRNMEILLAAHDLCRTYVRQGRKKTALSHISLQLHKHETMGIAGFAGSGKSALLRVLSLEEAPDSGTVVLWSGAGTGHDRCRHMQRVPRDGEEIFSQFMTAGDFLKESLRRMKVPAEEAGEGMITKVLEETGLPQELLSCRPGILSGWQRQQLLLARALLTCPEILLFDEPADSLDPMDRQRMILLLERLRKRYRFSGLFVSRDLSVLQQMSDRILVMDGGRIVERLDAGRLWSACHPVTRRLLAARLPDEGHDRGSGFPDQILCCLPRGCFYLESDPCEIRRIRENCAEREINASLDHRVLAYML